MADEDELAGWVEQLYTAAADQPELFPASADGGPFTQFQLFKQTAVRRGITTGINSANRVKFKLQTWYEDTEVEDKLSPLQKAALGTDHTEYAPPELLTDDMLALLVLEYRLEEAVPASADRADRILQIVKYENEVLAGISLGDGAPELVEVPPSHAGGMMVRPAIGLWREHQPFRASDGIALPLPIQVKNVQDKALIRVGWYASEVPDVEDPLLSLSIRNWGGLRKEPELLAVSCAVVGVKKPTPASITEAYLQLEVMELVPPYAHHMWPVKESVF